VQHGERSGEKITRSCDLVASFSRLLFDFNLSCRVFALLQLQNKTFYPEQLHVAELWCMKVVLHKCKSIYIIGTSLCRFGLKQTSP
jgi:hypothetical protein